VILDSVGDGMCWGHVGDGMCWGHGDGATALYATVDDSDLLVTANNDIPAMNSTKSIRNVSCIVPRLTSAPQTQC
jgi:hypothetical protein